MKSSVLFHMGPDMTCVCEESTRRSGPPLSGLCDKELDCVISGDPSSEYSSRSPAFEQEGLRLSVRTHDLSMSLQFS